MPMLEALVSTQLTVQGEALSAESVPHRAPMSSVVLHVSFNNFCLFLGKEAFPMRPYIFGILHQRMIITNLLLIIFFLGGGAFGLDKPKNGLGRLKGWDSFENFFHMVIR